jgi:hypothetical protein
VECSTRCAGSRTSTSYLGSREFESLGVPLRVVPFRRDAVHYQDASRMVPFDSTCLEMFEVQLELNLKADCS